MKWTLLLVFVNLVAGDGAWRGNHEYKYTLKTRTLTALPKLNSLWVGANYRALLTIHPQSESLLIGQLSAAEYAEVELSEKLDPNSVELEYKQLPLIRPFRVHLKNGVIYALSVSKTTTNDQINQLKVMLSQLQVDTGSGKNEIDDSDYGVFKKIEQTITGDCDTIYDITPIPDYSLHMDPELISLTRFKENGKFLNIQKTRNYNNCSEIIELMNERGSSQIHNSLLNSEATRIVLSGSRRSYAILSSVTTNRVVAFDSQMSTTIFHVQLKLDSMAKSSQQPEIPAGNMFYIRNLIYNKNVPSTFQSIISPLGTTTHQHGQFSQQDGRRWSECYTTFIAGSSMCKFSFDAEWEAVGSESSCGFLDLGHRIACKHSFPECQATACWSLFVGGLCQKEFGSRLPIQKSGFEDCSPGFWRHRCCPN